MEDCKFHGKRLFMFSHLIMTPTAEILYLSFKMYARIYLILIVWAKFFSFKIVAFLQQLLKNHSTFPHKIFFLEDLKVTGCNGFQIRENILKFDIYATTHKLSKIYEIYILKKIIRINLVYPTPWNITPFMRRSNFRGITITAAVSVMLQF